MPNAYDYKKEYKGIYLPKNKPKYICQIQEKQPEVTLRLKQRATKQAFIYAFCEQCKTIPEKFNKSVLSVVDKM